MALTLDLTLRRHQDADSKSMKRPKLKKDDIEKGLEKRKTNVDVDEMGDVRGRVHVGALSRRTRYRGRSC
jgi:ribosome production factor 2